MVNVPPAAVVVQAESVNQLTTPVEVEAAVNACPPAGALTGLPKMSWSWTLITLAAPGHVPAVMVREGVMKASWPPDPGTTSNAVLPPFPRPGEEATSV